MDAIWKSFVNEDEKIDSPEWHKDVLSDRLNKIADKKAEYLTIDELK